MSNAEWARACVICLLGVSVLWALTVPLWRLTSHISEIQARNVKLERSNERYKGKCAAYREQIKQLKADCDGTAAD